MEAVELHDRERIAAFCEQRPAVHAYALGDLEDFFWPHTRWFGLEDAGRLMQLAFLYEEHEPATLHALAEPPEETMSALLGAVEARLPVRFECHIGESSLAALTGAFATLRGPHPHVKMALARPELLARHGAGDVVVLDTSDVKEVEALYAAAYPRSWFHVRRLQTSRYVGIRERGRLVCVAGVHVHAPSRGVAVLGDVATMPRMRGRGLARTACASLCRLLRDDGCTTIALNVREDNHAAIGAYAGIGFDVVARYLEVELARLPTA